MAIPSAPPHSRCRWRRIIVGAGIGNALEWYDWTVYAVFAPFFAPQFFDGADPTSALLSTLAVFAAGFFMRPLGGLFFGVLADRKGRRFAMVLSMVVTAMGSLIIAVAPTYSSIGVVASALLLLGRLAQGFGLGGEIGVSYTFLAESAPPARRGLWSSSFYIAVTCGSVFATLEGAILSSVLDKTDMTEWGWRIPFIIGTLLGFYAFYLRGRLPETTAFEMAQRGAKRAGTLHSIWQNRTAAARIIGLVMGGTVAFYTWSVAAPGHAITVKRVEASSALWAGVVANLVFIVMLPLWGSLSDRFGRKPNVIAFAVGTAILTVPLDKLIQDQAWQLAVAMSVALTFQAAVSAIAPALFAELLPTHVRAAGTGFPYSIAVALFGGTAPFVQAWLADHGQAALFNVYTIILLAATLITIVITPECKERALE
jgi:MHS family alpha-ketoglutarate permease-like MFS transporter